jgi:hypothetical protein
MPNDEPPFRLYPGSNDAERKINNQHEAKPDDFMMRIACTLILICAVFVYFEQQRQGARLENERLKQRIIEQQQVIDSAPSASQIADEVKKALEQKTDAPVEKKPQKPVQVKRGGKQKPISKADEVVANPGLPESENYPTFRGMKND